MSIFDRMRALLEKYRDMPPISGYPLKATNKQADKNLDQDPGIHAVSLPRGILKKAKKKLSR